jgi:hypothetical protein
MPAKLLIAVAGRSYIDNRLTRRQQKAAASSGFFVGTVPS